MEDEADDVCLRELAFVVKVVKLTFPTEYSTYGIGPDAAVCFYMVIVPV